MKGEKSEKSVFNHAVLVDSEQYYRIGNEHHRMKSAIEEFIKILEDPSYERIPEYQLERLKEVKCLIKKDPILKSVFAN